MSFPNLKIPKDFYVNYSSQNPNNFLRLRMRTLGKGFDILEPKQKSKFAKIKSLPKLLSQQKITYINGKKRYFYSKINQGEKSFFESRLRCGLNRGLRRTSFKEKLRSLSQVIQLKPEIQQCYYEPNEKIQRAKRSRATSTMSTGYKNENNFSPSSYLKREFSNDRYDKPSINIETIIQNYKANSIRDFPPKKIKYYNLKLSPFVYNKNFINN